MHKRIQRIICTLLTAGLLICSVPQQQIPIPRPVPTAAAVMFNLTADGSTTSTTTKATTSATTATTTTTKASSTTAKASSTTASTNSTSATSKTTVSTTKSTSSATNTTATTKATASTVSATNTGTNSTSLSTTTKATTSTTKSTTRITTTTTAAPVKVSAEATFSGGYPGADTVLALSLKGNPGLYALGMTVTLPDILTAEADQNGRTTVEIGAAVPEENLLSYYDAKANTISVVFAAETAGAADPLICKIPLHIETQAEWGKKYPVKLTIDSMEASKGVTYEKNANATFIPDESPKRTLSAETLKCTETGEEQTLTLSPEPLEGSCIWTSSNPEIAAVDENGKVTAHAAGNAKITATCEKRTYICAVTVQFDRQLTPVSYTAKKQGETVLLALEPAPESPPKWSCTDEEILTVNAEGIAVVHGNGTAHITVSADEKEYHFLFPVTIPRKLNITEITIDDPTRLLALKLSPEPENSITFSSKNPEIASISNDGTVTFLKDGKTVITAECEGIKYNCNLYLQLKTCINLESCAAKKTGEQFQLCLLPPSTAGEAIHWSSSDEAVAKVTQYGLVTVKSEGKATITAESGGKKYTCQVYFQPYLRGDANLNEEVSVDDAQDVLQYYVNTLAQVKGNLNAQALLAADVDKNNAVDILDANAILRYYVMQMANQNPDWEKIISSEIQE